MPIPIEDQTDLLLVLLYTPGKSGKFGESIDGITRLQKLVFLIQQATDVGELVEDAKEYVYEPYKMGPFSKKLLRDIDDLRAAGIIVVERLEYFIPDDNDDRDEDIEDIALPEERPEKRVISLRFLLSSKIGMSVGKDLWESLTAKQQLELQKFKTFFNSITLRQLLVYTYERFPRYTSESIIKTQLGL